MTAPMAPPAPAVAPRKGQGRGPDPVPHQRDAGRHGGCPSLVVDDFLDGKGILLAPGQEHPPDGLSTRPAREGTAAAGVAAVSTAASKPWSWDACSSAASNAARAASWRNSRWRKTLQGVASDPGSSIRRPRRH